MRLATIPSRAVLLSEQQMIIVQNGTFDGDPATAAVRMPGAQGHGKEACAEQRATPVPTQPLPCRLGIPMMFNFSSLGRAPTKASWHSFSCVMRAADRDTRPRHADPIGAAAAQPPAGSGGRMVAGNWVRGPRTMENNITARPREQDNGYAVPSPICAAPVNSLTRPSGLD